MAPKSKTQKLAIRWQDRAWRPRIQRPTTGVGGVGGVEGRQAPVCPDRRRSCDRKVDSPRPTPGTRVKRACRRDKEASFIHRIYLVLKSRRIK
jgi:hypothetical protein